MPWIEIDRDERRSVTTRILPFGNGVLVKVTEYMGINHGEVMSVVYVPIDKESIDKEVKYHETSKRT